MNKKSKQTARLIWTGVIIITVLFALNLLLARSEGRRQYEGLPTGSTYSQDPDGAELLYRTLEELGFPITRFRGPLLAGSVPKNSPDVIWHAYGSVPFEPEEVDWVSGWVNDGGTLVLIADPYKEISSTDPFAVQYDDLLIESWLEKFKLESNVREVQPLAEKTGLSALPHRMIVGAPTNWELGQTREIHTYKRRGLVNPVVYRFMSLEVSGRSSEAVIRDGYGTVVARASYGAGQVWMVADPYLFSNLLLQEADNAIVAASIIVGSKGGEQSSVLFDEYHLGFVQTRSIMDAARTPAGKGILFLGLVAVLALGTAGARFGSVRKPRGAIGVSQRAFVKALAGLWLGANATTAAADALWRRYRSQQQVRRKGLDTKLDELRRSNPRIDDLIEIARRLDSA